MGKNPDIQILSAFEVPKIIFNPSKKQFFPVQHNNNNRNQNNFSKSPNSANSFFGTAIDKDSVSEQRFELILQRVKRELPEYEFTPLSSLLGEVGTKIIFGCLTQLNETGEYHLEDPKTVVKLDLTDTKYTPGLFCEGCFVIAHGFFDPQSSKFKVSIMGMPSAETREKTLSLLKPHQIDLFSPIQTNSKETKFKGLILNTNKESDAIPPNSYFMIFSDVFLDQHTVFSQLQILFEDCSDNPPDLFIFMGNFTNGSKSPSENKKSLTNGFERLATLISSYPSFKTKTKFIFSPGPSDSLSQTLPQKPLLPHIISSLKEKVLNSFFTSNPFRIRFYGQDLIFYREDLISKLKRHCIIHPNEQLEELNDHIVRTLFDQSHLCPLALNSRPTLWNFDSSLWIYPLPDAIFLADKSNQYENEYCECKCANPGSFALDFSFITYYPADKHFDFSRIDQ